MYRTDDPSADWDRHCAKQDEWLERRPKCSMCGEHIQDDTAVRIGNEWYCDDCLDECREEVGDD